MDLLSLKGLLHLGHNFDILYKLLTLKHVFPNIAFSVSLFRFTIFGVSDVDVFLYRV